MNWKAQVRTVKAANMPGSLTAVLGDTLTSAAGDRVIGYSATIAW